MSQLSMTLPRPKNQMAHLLREMLRGKKISERQFSYNRFRGSLSDLRTKFGIPIRYQDVPFKNTFGRESHYRKHFIKKVDRRIAVLAYKKINNR